MASMKEVYPDKDIISRDELAALGKPLRGKITAVEVLPTFCERTQKTTVLARLSLDTCKRKLCAGLTNGRRLIKAFGDDKSQWVGKEISASVEMINGRPQQVFRPITGGQPHAPKQPGSAQ
jgi:hypothetical protein